MNRCMQNVHNRMKMWFKWFFQIKKPLQKKKITFNDLAFLNAGVPDILWKRKEKTGEAILRWVSKTWYFFGIWKWSLEDCRFVRYSTSYIKWFFCSFFRIIVFLSNSSRQWSSIYTFGLCLRNYFLNNQTNLKLKNVAFERKSKKNLGMGT